MSQRSLFSGLAVTAGLLTLIGCAGAPEEQGLEPLGVAEEAIKGGYEDTGDTNVVGIFNIKEGFLCSGSLIAPNVVLTAHHCVSPILDETAAGGVDCQKTRFDKSFDPTSFIVTTKQDLRDATGDIRVRQILTPDDPSVCGTDQAIMILDKNMDPSEATPLVPRVDVSIVPNDVYYAIGYGAIEDDEMGTGAGERRRRDDLLVNCVGDGCPSAIDKPVVAPTEWQGQEGICGGDSGGPALDSLNRVIGVTSRGGVECTTPVYGHVFGLGQWIKDTTVFAAGLGGYPAPAWATGWPTDPDYSFPIGGACQKPEDCASSRCFNQVCTRLCNAAAPCGEGFTCDDQNLKVCVQTQGSAEIKQGGGVPSAGGCSVSPGFQADPTRPVPWFAGGALFALGLLRRRSPPTSSRARSRKQG